LLLTIKTGFAGSQATGWTGLFIDWGLAWGETNYLKTPLKIDHKKLNLPCFSTINLLNLL